MGWYVEFLLLNRDEIREGVMNEYSDLESDEFNDLLIVEKELEKFIKQKIISSTEIEVVDLIIDTPSLNKAQDYSKYNRVTLSKIFKQVCERIAYSLGHVFTDEGYLDHMREKYHLTEEQVRKLEQYMISKYRHRLMTKPYTKG